ncbi:MAG: HAD-IIB family hydrolase [Gammaproteobacteria bacterium]|nr:HAD-IIB family hydrolase [Gammaproteobacteria bacterium]
MTAKTKHYIVLISAHGLIRGHDLELGRDADTGGQTLYVVELARALAAHPDVERVDLLTRRIIDSKVDSDYANPLEELGPGAHIVRLDCGPKRYLRKEVLWPHMECFIDKALQHVRSIGRAPDVIHGHYADAGYIGSRIAGLLGVPFVFTGHSLGRVKRKRLLERGIKPENIESQYNMNQRIEAEESALDNAALVIASTEQEVQEQYEIYDNYQTKRMEVIAPGVDLSRFTPPRRDDPEPHIQNTLNRFLENPKKPMILALSRADERKNIASLLHAYGNMPELQDAANLVIVAGNRSEISNMDKGAREVLTEMLMLIDRYDLYGKVAYPKYHRSADVPNFYKLAAKSRGIFINPALTEPFGLTLIEAAASGLPIIATHDGGPKDIIKHCKNGKLIDPLNTEKMGRLLFDAVSNNKHWLRCSRNGIKGAHEHYSWPGHVQKYLRAIQKITNKKTRTHMAPEGRSRLPTVDRIAIASIDSTLVGDEPGLRALMDRIRYDAENCGFGIATARPLENALRILRHWNLPVPDILISAMGSEIHYGHQGKRLIPDHGWHRHIDYRWDRKALSKAMKEIPGIKLQPKNKQSDFKLSYTVDPDKLPLIREIKQYLRKMDLPANIIYSHEHYLDILPIRVSKGQAVRYLALKWGFPLGRFMVVGDSGNDEDMLTGETLAVIVANYSHELEKLKGKNRIYFANSHHAWGVLEGLEYYDFLGDIRVPGEEIDEDRKIA